MSIFRDYPVLTNEEIAAVVERLLAEPKTRVAKAKFRLAALQMPTLSGTQIDFVANAWCDRCGLAHYNHSTMYGATSVTRKVLYDLGVTDAAYKRFIRRSGLKRYSFGETLSTALVLRLAGVWPI